MTEGATNVLLGGGLVILGGFISQGFAWVFLKRQQKHDSEQRSKEREYQTKREIYVKLIEEYSLLIAQLGNLSTKEFTPTLVSEATVPFSTAISKTQLVADHETVDSLVDVAIEIQKIVQETLAKLMPLWGTQFELDSSIKLYDKYSEQQDLILQDMGKLNLTPDSDVERQTNYLSQKFEGNKKLLGSLMQERTALNVTLAQQKIGYLRSISENIMELDQISWVAFNALRRELGYQTSEKYLSAQKAKIEFAKKSLQLFIDDLETKVRDENESTG